MYEGVTEDNCQVIEREEDVCLNSSIKSGTGSNDAATCGEETPIEDKETICSSNDSSTTYYQVDVDKKYSSQVDYEEYSEKPGVGFKYNVIIREENKIVATFDKDNWEKVYKENYDEMQKYDETSPWYWYYKKGIDTLESTLNYYNDNHNQLHLILHILNDRNTNFVH